MAHRSGNQNPLGNADCGNSGEDVGGCNHNRHQGGNGGPGCVQNRLGCPQCGLGSPSQGGFPGNQGWNIPGQQGGLGGAQCDHAHGGHVNQGGYGVGNQGEYGGGHPSARHGGHVDQGGYAKHGY